MPYEYREGAIYSEAAYKGRTNMMMDNRYGAQLSGAPMPSCEEAVAESRTVQISNMLDGAQKTLEMLYVMLRDRADSLLGSEPNAQSRDDNAKQLKTIDRGSMDRITRQVKELHQSMDALEFQIRRLNQL